MSLFGALDLEDIAEVPDTGSYLFVLRGIRSIHTQSGKDFLVWEYVMEEEDSDFNGESFDKWFRVYPNLTSLEDLSDDERRQVRRDFLSLRDWMRAHGVPEDELNDFNYEELTGTRGYIYGYQSEPKDGGQKRFNLTRFKME